MANWIVRVDNLTDAELVFFGWVKLDPGEEFSLYWNPRYNETQPVSNDPPRYLVVDDLNDAAQMARGAPVMAGPQRSH